MEESHIVRLRHFTLINKPWEQPNFRIMCPVAMAKMDEGGKRLDKRRVIKRLLQ